MKTFQDLHHLLCHIFSLIACVHCAFFFSQSKKFCSLTLCGCMKLIFIKVRKRKNIFWAGYSIPGCFIFFQHIICFNIYFIAFHVYPKLTFVTFYCFVVFLLLGYCKFDKGILLAFLSAAIATVILIFCYYYS